MEPWVEGERDLGDFTLFGRASFAYAQTGSGAPDLSGGEADSADFDDAYAGLRFGDTESGLWEIAGGWFISNSNLRSHMLRVTWQARADVRIGASFFDFTLDQPGTFEGGVASDSLAQEFDLIVDWSPLDFLNVTFVLANGNPGAAVEEAFDRRNCFRYGMSYLGLAFD